MSHARASLLAGSAVALLAGAALSLTHGTVRGPLPARSAIADARRDPATIRLLRGAAALGVSATPVDEKLDRVRFSAGARVIADVAVDRRGQVVRTIDYRAPRAIYGNWLAYSPALLVLLSALFVLVTAVVPLRRVRNLDVAAMLSFLAPVELLRLRYLDASVLAATPGLVYLLVRCVRVALGAPAAVARQTPLFDVLTRRHAAQRGRLLRCVLIALSLVFLMVTVTSTGAVDVVIAVMEGATRLAHGVLPYGHMPGDIIHGDTYPVLTYALYVPVAWLGPVQTAWDSVDAGLAVAGLAAVACALILVRGLRRAAGSETELPALRAGIACLAFPPLLAAASSGTTDVVLAAMLLLAALLWRRPAAGAGVLALAGWFKLAPFALLVPFLAPLRRAALLRALCAAGAVTVAALALVVGVGGAAGVTAMVHAVGWQLQRGSPQSLWAVLDISAAQPLAQAATLGLLAYAGLRLSLQPALARRRERVAGLLAAVLVALQLSADYWSYLYLSWIVPLICLALLTDVSGTIVPQRPRRAAPGRRGDHGAQGQFAASRSTSEAPRPIKTA